MRPSTTETAGEYREIFDKRGDRYNRANRLCPHARETERQLLLDLLRLSPEHVLCDAAAGGGYLAEAAARTIPPGRIICVDPAHAFAREIDPRFPRLIASIERVPLRDRSVDRVSCLAALHHVTDRAAFFSEAGRVLRSGGRLAVADVMGGTAPARFLNGPVDRLSLTGHQGVFFSPGELTWLLEQAGFTAIQEQHQQYTWDFPDRPTLYRFCTDLFGLSRGTAKQVRNEIDSYLTIEMRPADGSPVRLHWSLLYAVGVKR